jgi:excisionase family DNA binding protein
MLDDLARMRRSPADFPPVLRLLDALSRAADSIAADGKLYVLTTKIESGDAPRLGPASTLSTKQAATAMGIPVRTVTWLLKTGRLEGWKLGREWVLPASSIDSWLEGKGR